MNIMFSKQKSYDIDMPGYFRVPMKFKIHEFEAFIDQNLEAHSKATAIFVEEFSKYEEIYDKVITNLGIQAILFHSDQVMHLDKHILTLKILFKYLNERDRGRDQMKLIT